MAYIQIVWMYDYQSKTQFYFNIIWDKENEKIFTFKKLDVVNV